MLGFLSDDMRRDPAPLYAQLRAGGPVIHVPPMNVWLALGYDEVKRALTDHELFSSAVTPPTGKAPDWLIFSDPPRHAALRGTIVKAFTPRSIAALEPRVRALSGELLSQTGSELDLVEAYSGPLPAMVIAEMIGIPIEDRARFLGWSDAIVGLTYALAGGAEAERMIAAHAVAKEEMRGYTAELIEARRRTPKDDLLGRLVSEGLGATDILGFFQLLLAAGTETTTNVISSAILLFAENPGELARLRADPTLLPAAIEEVVRVRTPAQFVFRETRRDLELGGVAIPAGKLVLVVIASANRDPKVFHTPDRFDVGRDPNPHLGFGHGIHFCLGAALSRMEARVALTDLLALGDFELTGTWEPRKALNALGPARLPVKITRR
jgi:cytochrome P450